MKKAYRVKKEKEFQKVFNASHSFANRNFIVYILQKPQQKHFRVGISVGKKIGNAVARNRVKRKIRQGLYEIKDTIQPDFDFIIIARPAAAELTMADVKKNLIHVLNLAHLVQ